MTNSSRILLISIALFMLGAVGPMAALAKGPPNKLAVTEAIPAEATQGDTDKAITLKGGPFSDDATVTFIVSATGQPAAAGKMVTKNIVFKPDTGDLEFDLDVAPDADPGDYDIGVTSGGRKGKGTSLFKVQSSKNEIASCMEVFFPDENLATTDVICDCVFGIPGANAPYYWMQDDCSTSATLKLEANPITSSSASTPDGLEMSTLTAIPGRNGSPFQGSSVISNMTNRAGVRFLNFRFDPAVARGCGPWELQSAVSFVLDENTTAAIEHSFLDVSDITVDTNVYDENGNSLYNDPLCTAVEILRFTPVDDAGNKDRLIFVYDAEIADGSYEDVGIHVEGMQPNASINPTLVASNDVGAPACEPGSGASPIAILFGGILLSDPHDPASQIPGEVESNIIHMENDNCDGAVGIRIVGEPFSDARTPYIWPQTTAVVVKNVISGAVTGVEVDCDVVDVQFSGNTFIGLPEPDDVGIFSEALNTGTKGKPNKWVEYDKDVELIEDRSGCTP